DGTKIAFASSRGDPRGGNCHDSGVECNFDIYVVNADGTGLTRLTDDPALDPAPTWSPDGSKIAWASRNAVQLPREFKLWVMNANGTGKTQLTSTGGDAPNWSPDGSKIAFGANTINVINPDGTGEMALNPSGG